MPLADAVVAFRRALADHEGYGAAFAALVASSGTASERERDTAITALLDVTGLEPHAELTGFLCVASGAIVEDGGSALVGIDVILDWLADGAAVLAAAGPALADASLDATDRMPPAELARDERRWVAGFKSHVRGAMARLARSPEARRRARAHPRLAGAIAALAARTRSRHVAYIGETLALFDDEPLVVIDLAAGGHVARYRAFGIRNGFHLMTVLDLQDPLALVRKRVDMVELRHGYHPWTALRADLTASPYDLLLGELPASAIPEFEGVRTVLRAPPAPARSFSTSLIAPFHEALRAELVTESELAPATARLLLARMCAAATR